MPIDVHLFPCLTDNYGFLVRDRETGVTACVDTPDGEAVLREAHRLGWSLGLVLNTHWHLDHTAGNGVVQAATGAPVFGPAEVARTGTAPDRIVAEGDVVELGATRFEVWETGGHTLGHVSFIAREAHAAFVGDTLFSLGCGRLFEGSPEQMWTSLSRLASLPDETVVWCAHEYTASNARFALSLDHDERLAERARAVFAARDRGEATVPTTIGEEKATNPFLRAGGAEAFAAVRAAKDAFKG